MADSGTNWSDQQKYRLMELHRDGQTYESIANTMNKSIKSVKSMCESIDNDQNAASNKQSQWNDQLLSINAPLITQQQNNEKKKEEDELHSIDSNSATSLSNQQQIPWPANNETTNNENEQTQTQNEQIQNEINESSQQQNCQKTTKISDDTQQSIPKTALDTNDDRDSDCVIISVSNPSPKQPQQTQQQQQIVATTEKRSIHKTKSIAATPIGHQGSAVEYKRLIQKYGQSMRYFVNETVIYFVPRLAQRGRFKDRIGRILKKMDDNESKYEIVDTQNGKKEIVPWKWILKQPKSATSNVSKQTSPNSTEQIAQIPMHSLSSKEEKLQEFDRRMKRISHCKQYSVPLNDSSQYFDEYERGHHKIYNSDFQEKGKQIRSLSVFPQRFSEHKKQKLYSPPPPLQRDRVKMNKMHKTKILKSEKKIIDIASSEDVDTQIKKEKVQSSLNVNTQKIAKLRRKRSRSRSPSHIRPSNRIINRSLNGTPRYAQPHTFVEPFDPYKLGRFRGGYDRDYDRLYFREDRQRKVDKLASNKVVRSRSRSRSRERDRERDRNRNYYRREYTPPMAPPPPHGSYVPFDGGHSAYDDRRRNYTPPHAHHASLRGHRYDHAQVVREGMAMDGSRLMRSWLSVVDRMRGGSKLTEREITFLCKNDVWPSQIKQLMDSDKRVQEKYDLVAHYLDPSSGQNLSRSQIYSIIGAVITMKF